MKNKTIIRTENQTQYSDMVSVQQVHGEQEKRSFQRFCSGKSKKGGQTHGQHNLNAASN
jgi:hypothetical protein